MEPRKELPKARINNQLKESANRILDIYLKEVDTIPEICDTVYAMGRAIGFNMGKLVKAIKVIERRKMEMEETDGNGS